MNSSFDDAAPRPFSLGLYLLIVFGLSWPFQIAGAVWATDLPMSYAWNSASMIMVTVGTFIAGRYVFRDGFANAGWRWGRAKHYLMVIGLVLLVWCLPTAVELALENLSLPDSLTGKQTVWIIVLLFVTLIPGFGEEFGWRGYMLPRLAHLRGVRWAVTLHAVIWWAWHLPALVKSAIIAAGMAEPGTAAILTVMFIIVVGALPAILHGVVFAYIWTRSRSLAVATVYHAAYDGVRDSLALTIGLGSIVGAWANLVLILLGIFFLWKGDWSNINPGDVGEVA